MKFLVLLLVFVLTTVLQSQSSFVSFVESRSTGPSPVLERLQQQAKENNGIVVEKLHLNNNFPHSDLHQAILILDHQMPTTPAPPTTSSTTTTTTTAFPTTSTTATTSSTTLLASTTTTTIPPPISSSSTTYFNSSSVINSTESNETSSSSSTTFPTTSSSTTTTSTTVSSTTTAAPTTTTTTSSTTTSTSTTTTTTLPPTTLTSIINFSTTTPGELLPSYTEIDDYQVVLTTSSQVISYRLNQFSDVQDFSSNIFWSVGKKSDRSYVDGIVSQENENENNNKARFNNPAGITPIYTASSQKFPFPTFRGFLVTEKSWRSLRFILFQVEGKVTYDDNNQNNQNNVLENSYFDTISSMSPISVHTISTKVNFNQPDGLSSVTSGGLVFIADDTCVRVMYGEFLDFFRNKNTIPILANSTFFTSPTSSGKNNRNNFTALNSNFPTSASVQTFAGECGSGGASDGHATIFARFFQVQNLIVDPTESVLFLSQRFGFIRKVVPIPRSSSDLEFVSKIATVTTITETLSPGTTTQQLLLTSLSFDVNAATSLLIVSVDGCFETNATTLTAVSESPLLVGLYGISSLFSSSSSQSQQIEKTKSIVPLSNGTVLVLTETSSYFLKNAFAPFSPTQILFPPRPSHSETMSNSVVTADTHELTATNTKSDSYPTHAITETISHLETVSPKITLTHSNSYSAESKSDFGGGGSKSLSHSETEHYITPSLSQTIFFFRPRSIIPATIMRIYINRAALGFGLLGIFGFGVSNPSSSLLASRIVSTVDSCSCPTLPVTKIEPSLKYFTGLAFGVSDQFVIEWPAVDEKLLPKEEQQSSSSSSSSSSSETSSKTNNNQNNNNQEQNSLLYDEKILPRIRAVIAMHVGTSLCLGPPLLLGLRIVDGFVATLENPAAVRLGFLSVIVSIWLQGGVSASVALILLTPDPRVDITAVAAPHLIFVFLVCIIVPSRLTWNSLHCEPRPVLEQRDYALEELYERELEEEELRKKEESDEALLLGGGNDNDNARIIDFDDDEEEKDMKNKTSGENENENNQNSSSKSNKNGSNNNNNKKRRRALKHETSFRKKIWKSIKRFSQGNLYWLQIYSESFPRSFPLIQPLIATSLSSLFGWLFVFHVVISIGIAILEGYRYAAALSQISFGVECDVIPVAVSAGLYSLSALVFIVVHIICRNELYHGPFISPPISIGHFLVVFFSAAAKILQVVCSFPDSVFFVGKTTDFQSDLVSVADVCTCIAVFGLALITFPLFITTIKVLSKKLKNCGSGCAGADLSSNSSKRSAAVAVAGASSQNINLKDLGNKKGELWKFLDKMEKKQVSKPLHLDMLRRPLRRSAKRKGGQGYNNSGFVNNDIDVDDLDLDDDENVEMTLHGGAVVSRKQHDEGQDEIFMEGASIHAEEPGAYDTLEKFSYVLRTEQLEEKKLKREKMRKEAVEKLAQAQEMALKLQQVEKEKQLKEKQEREGGGGKGDYHMYVDEDGSFDFSIYSPSRKKNNDAAFAAAAASSSSSKSFGNNNNNNNAFTPEQEEMMQNL